MSGEKVLAVHADELCDNGTVDPGILAAAIGAMAAATVVLGGIIVKAGFGRTDHLSSTTNSERLRLLQPQSEGGGATNRGGRGRRLLQMDDDGRPLRRRKRRSVFSLLWSGRRGHHPPRGRPPRLKRGTRSHDLTLWDQVMDLLHAGTE